MSKVANNKKLNKDLDSIAQRLKDGEKYEDILAELDMILGIELKDRDLEIEKVFEVSRSEELNI